VDRTWHRALKEGDVATVRAQLAAGVNPDARDRYGQTGLMIAAWRGHAGVVDALIEAGARLDVTAKYGLSALMLAVVGGHPEIARRLVHAGADRSIRGNGAPGFARKTASELARERGLRELAEELAPLSDD
jgi:ankyrin repeat protein